MKRILYKIVLITFVSIVSILLGNVVKSKLDPYNFTAPSSSKLIMWVHEHVEYKSDFDSWGVEQYTQTAAETMLYRTGDCEDYCRLLNDLYYEHYGIRLPYALLHMPDQIPKSQHHMVLYYESDDYFIDPTFGEVYVLSKYADYVVGYYSERDLIAWRSKELQDGINLIAKR